MKRALLKLASSAAVGCLCAVAASAQDTFILSSPAMADESPLAADLKCARDDGDGVSPPLEWSGVPADAESLALIMYHYPNGTVEGVDPPSQYWLLWNIPIDTNGLERGNPLSIGDEGSNKDGVATGYTPPCSPKRWLSFSRAPEHQYFIELFALNAPLSTLPAHDDLSVDWTVLTAAMQDKVIATSRISFWN